MKNKLNIFLVVSSVLAVLCSCSKDKDENVKFLKQLVETSADGTSTTTDFTYNGDEIKSIDGVKQHTDFSYMDGLITKMVVSDKTNKTVNTIEYSYLRGKLISVKSLNNYTIKYTANSDGSVAYERFDINAENKEVKIYHGTLYFEKDNFIKDQRTFDNAPSGVSLTYTASFEYDAKSNPFHSIMGYEKLLDHNDIISVNNSLISVATNTSSQNDQIISSANFYKSTFKYDDDGYPIERVSEAVMPVNGNSEYKKSEYFY